MWRRHLSSLSSVSAVCLLSANLGMADISSTQRLSHWFNAHLLAEREAQVNVLGNVKFGLLPDLEIGTQAAMLGLLSSPNFYVKHRMFTGDAFTTSFVSHLYGLRLPLSANPEKDDEANNAEGSANAAGDTYHLDLLFGFVGITTTHALDSKQDLSWGVYDIYLGFNDPYLDIEGRIHAVGAGVSYDFILTPNIAFTGIVLIPAYANVAVESEIGDIVGNINMLTAQAKSSFAGLGMATVTFSGKTLNLEGGAIATPTVVRPYINVFWRFP